MADPYASLKATAARLIAAKGVAVTWAKLTATAAGGDPWNPQPDVTDPATYTPSVVFFPVGLQSQRTLQALLGVEVPEGYEYGLLAGNVAFTPEMSDIVTRNGVVLPIARVDTLAPDGTAILHTVYFRR